MSGECVLIAAGGTGGHVFPGLAVAHELAARAMPVVWLGTRQGLEARLVPAAGIEIEWMQVSGLRGRGLLNWLLAPLRLARALAQAMRVLRRRRPMVVLGLGGFVSGPAGLAAWLTGKPLIIHEQNAIAGMTNRVLARLARQVLEAFPGSFGRRTAVRCVGNPVRTDIAALPPPAERLAGRTGPVRLLVVGGSQGAARLNSVLPQALARLDPLQRPLVRHQAGQRHLEDARVAYQRSGVQASVDAFIDDMAAAYGWADLVLCRSGALTVFELAAAGIGALLVPFPYAVDDHQTRNAEHLVRIGAARLLPERELEPGRLAAELERLCADRDALLRMAVNARRSATPQAAAVVADCCLQIGGRR